MRHFAVALLALALFPAASLAGGHGSWSFAFGFGGGGTSFGVGYRSCGWGGYWGGCYPYASRCYGGYSGPAYYPAAYYPAPVYYAPPQPQVVYVQPRVVYTTPTYVYTALPAVNSSPTYYVAPSQPTRPAPVSTQVVIVRPVAAPLASTPVASTPVVAPAAPATPTSGYYYNNSSSYNTVASTGGYYSH